MKVKPFVTILGIVFVVIGIAGFIPALAPANDHGELLLGIFQVNQFQSLFHIFSGIVALSSIVMAKDYYIATYLKVFGVVYALLAIWGLSVVAGGNNDGVLFGLVHVNMATELLHIVIALSTLYFGFMVSSKPAATPAA